MFMASGYNTSMSRKEKNLWAVFGKKTPRPTQAISLAIENKKLAIREQKQAGNAELYLLEI